MTLDKTCPNRYTEEREHKPKAQRPPRGSVVKKRNGDYKVYLDTCGVKVYIGCYKERKHAVSAYWQARADANAT